MNFTRVFVPLENRRRVVSASDLPVIRKPARATRPKPKAKPKPKVTATARWKAAIAAKVAGGMSQPDAVRRLASEQPELRAAYVREANVPRELDQARRDLSVARRISNMRK